MVKRKIKKLLIANRGEIACRIIKTAKKMSIHTIAVYSDIDSQAMHVTLADESHCIGLAPSNQSYLCIDKIINLAKKSNADAIHPGYGFLSENTEFAKACFNNNIIFIGPPIDALQLMASKTDAKACMQKANVPTVPGHHGGDANLEQLKQIANNIGYPILLKASAGGGGKGMRLVHKPSEIADALASAKREAKASFGDDSVFLEKLIQPARHVELQIFADTHGNVVHLFDRDCSVQRRHQKIIEEAPAPFLKEKTHQAMAATAVKAADTINYVGAGTIEFLVDNQENFYFMEMNTRLQVEHPVTELITGVDLVEWQIKVAEGEKLPLTQQQIQKNGHAIEARICAENPKQNFNPSIGRLTHLDTPEISDTVRLDTGVSVNDEISMFYDPMIAKLIAWGENRNLAIENLLAALADLHIAGVDTNINLIAGILKHNDFKNEKINTDFINNHYDTLINNASLATKNIVAIASLIQFQQLQHSSNQLAKTSQDITSPWFKRDGWRLWNQHQTHFKLWENTTKHDIYVSEEKNQYSIFVNNQPIIIQVNWQDPDYIACRILQQEIVVKTVLINHKIHLFYEYQHFIFDINDPHALATDMSSGENHLTAPMPGTVVKVFVKPGDKVKKGDKLIILEAMKMEHTLVAPNDGVIKEILHQAGDTLTEGVELVEFQQEE